MTTILVLAVPVLDVAWTIVRRALSHRSITQADRGHVHHLFLKTGFSQRGAVLFLYAVGLLFGVAGVFLQSSQKMVLLLALVLFVVLLLGILNMILRYAKRFP